MSEGFSELVCESNLTYLLELVTEQLCGSGLIVSFQLVETLFALQDDRTLGEVINDVDLSRIESLV